MAKKETISALAAGVAVVIAIAEGAIGARQEPTRQAAPSAALYANPVFPAYSPWEWATPATADFDGDGHLDLAVGGCCSAVTVLPGIGDGTFAPGAVYPAGHGPAQLLAEDFNGDGRPDLAVSDGRGTSGVSVLIGRGDGTLLPKTDYATGEGPWSMAKADLNGDGFVDLATANAWSNDVSILLGRGDGTFEPERRFGAGAYPDSIVVGDVDSDGRLDLVTANFDLIAILRGRGDGTFEAVSGFAPGFNVAAIAAADLDGDGRLDLVARTYFGASPEGPGFAVLRGNGDGSFGAPGFYGAHTGHELGAQSLALHDVDRDGHHDVVMPAYTDAGSGVAIAFGNGDGTFLSQQLHGHPGHATAVAFADLDADGATDIAAVHSQADGVAVLFNSGGRTFGLEPVTHAVGDGPLATVLADFDGDRLPDVAALNARSNDVSLLSGRGDGSFLPERRFSLGAAPTDCVADDFDGDARADLAVALRAAGAVAILSGREDGTLAPPVRWAAGADSRALVSADLDRDGDPDLAVANRSAGTVSILIGGGDGSFLPPASYPIIAPWALAAADFDGDGHVDLAVSGNGCQACCCPGSLLWLLAGHGDGTFTVSSPTVLDRAPAQGLAAADLDGDGRTELILSGDRNEAISIWRVRSDRTFENTTTPGKAGNRPYVAIGDADGDGVLDIVGADCRTVTIYPGQGSGAFGEGRTFLAAFQCALPSVALGDLNLDGGLDIVLPWEPIDKVLVMLNQRPRDSDGDGVADARDNCPTIPNPDQDPEACRQAVVDVTIEFGSPLGRGSGTVSWRTTHEVTLTGFNILGRDARGLTVRLNVVPIPCLGCVTGEGHSYTFIVPKHKGGRDLYIETLCSGECGGLWGPAVRP